MLGWILGAIGAAVVCSTISGKNKEIESLRLENNFLRVTISNHSELLHDYNNVNNYAKQLGYKGAVDFFYYLSREHDYRFETLARFLNYVRHIRNDVAHNGAVYQIDRNFLDKLAACWEVCRYYQGLSYGERLRLN